MSDEWTEDDKAEVPTITATVRTEPRHRIALRYNGDAFAAIVIEPDLLGADYCNDDLTPAFSAGVSFTGLLPPGTEPGNYDDVTAWRTFTAVGLREAAKAFCRAADIMDEASAKYRTPTAANDFGGERH